jgi:hypothetical protein
MNEGTIHLADEDSASDLDAAARKSAAVDSDRLATTRIASHATPSPSRRPHVPAMAVPPPGASHPPVGLATEGTLPYGTEPPPPLPRTSWWRALIASTLAPSASGDDKTGTRRIAAACVAFAVLLVPASLVIGLRGEPSASSPMLSATIVITRSLLALGVLVFSHNLLRMAERILKRSE